MDPGELYIFWKSQKRVAVAEGMAFNAVAQRRSAVQSKVQRGMKNEDLLRHGRQKVFLQGLHLGPIVVVIRFVVHNLPWTLIPANKRA